jgi:hypothetical protein
MRGRVVIPGIKPGRSHLAVRLIDTSGQFSRDHVSFDIECIPDRGPTIEIVSPEHDVVASISSASATVPIQVRAVDDLGIDRVGIEWQVHQRAVGETDERDDEVERGTTDCFVDVRESTPAGQFTPTQFAFALGELDLRTIHARAEDTVRYRAFVIDNRGEAFGKAQRVDSRWQVIRVVDESRLSNHGAETQTNERDDENAGAHGSADDGATNEESSSRDPASDSPDDNADDRSTAGEPSTGAEDYSSVRQQEVGQRTDGQSSSNARESESDDSTGDGPDENTANERAAPIEETKHLAKPDPQQNDQTGAGGSVGEKPQNATTGPEENDPAYAHAQSTMRRDVMGTDSTSESAQLALRSPTALRAASLRAVPLQYRDFVARYYRAIARRRVSSSRSPEVRETEERP